MQCFTTVTIPPSVLEGWVTHTRKKESHLRVQLCQRLTQPEYGYTPGTDTLLWIYSLTVPPGSWGQGLLWAVMSYKQFCISSRKCIPVFLICRCFIFLSSEGANPCSANVNLMKLTCLTSVFKGLFKLSRFYSLFHFPLSPPKQSYKM